MKKLLLHVCCAPCSSAVVEKLQQEGFNVTIYFYNPNIHPKKEYEKRKNELKNWCNQLKIQLQIAKYEDEKWYKKIKGLENESEKGKRCTVCYAMRLEETAQYAKTEGFDIFTTALSISPHKDAERINQLGKTFSEKYNVKFLEANFKKQGGFQRSLELSKQYNFYRQNYCGCEFSMR